MKCFKCGATIAKRSIFCNICGIKLENNNKRTTHKIKQIENYCGILLNNLPKGVFIMGNNNGIGSDKPENNVIISKELYMSIYPITQKQYENVMNENPSGFLGNDKPVEWVSWYDAKSFCEILNLNDKELFYRLPTEAEWEFACKANRSWGIEKTEKMGWNRNISEQETHNVGKIKANPWGFFDMLGNVWEWCEDWYDSKYYVELSKNERNTDPCCNEKQKCKVLRGGSWFDVSQICNSTFRSFNYPTYASGTQGFRIVAEKK